MYTLIITDPADQISALGLWEDYEAAESDKYVILDKLEKEHVDFSAKTVEINTFFRIDPKAEFTILFDAADNTGEYYCSGLFQNKDKAYSSWLCEYPGYGSISVIPFSF